MGNSEEEKLCKPEKPPSPPTDQNGFHVHPDWPMMQAYYGPQFLPPYLNSAVGSPHTPPPYMWVAPQSMVPPYGVPYAAYYAHGGIFRHPGASTAGTALSTDISVQSSGKTDGGSKKKSKEVNGHTILIGDGNADSGEHGTDHRPSSGSDETDDSSDGSNGVIAEAGQSGMKRNRPGSPNAEDVLKAHKKGSSIPSTPHEAWLLNERELKRERRKQSNRDSARRSRLRKQAEAGQLSIKVQALITENTTLKSKIDEFVEATERLELENAKLMEKLKDGQSGEVKSQKMDDCTANLLERVNESDHKNRAKLHQLFDAIASPRADAVAAS